MQNTPTAIVDPGFKPRGRQAVVPRLKAPEQAPEVHTQPQYQAPEQARHRSPAPRPGAGTHRPRRPRLQGPGAGTRHRSPEPGPQGQGTDPTLCFPGSTSQGGPDRYVPGPGFKPRSRRPLPSMSPVSGPQGRADQPTHYRTVVTSSQVRPRGRGTKDRGPGSRPRSRPLVQGTVARQQPASGPHPGLTHGTRRRVPCGASRAAVPADGSCSLAPRVKTTKPVSRPGSGLQAS